MNVYNEAHNLARALKECDELKTYQELKEKIQKTPELASAIADFQSLQMQAQLKQMAGEELDPETAERVQQLYGILLRDPAAAVYMQAEMRFSLMMNDVYQILGEAIGQVSPFAGAKEEEK